MLYEGKIISKKVSFILNLMIWILLGIIKCVEILCYSIRDGIVYPKPVYPLYHQPHIIVVFSNACPLHDERYTIVYLQMW